MPGTDGVLIEWGDHRGTFLPQMWDQLPDPSRLAGHLKRKAGLDTRLLGARRPAVEPRGAEMGGAVAQMNSLIFRQS